MVEDWTGIPVGRMVKNEVEAVLGDDRFGQLAIALADKLLEPVFVVGVSTLIKYRHPCPEVHGLGIDEGAVQVKDDGGGGLGERHSDLLGCCKDTYPARPPGTYHRNTTVRSVSMPWRCRSRMR